MRTYPQFPCFPGLRLEPCSVLDIQPLMASVASQDSQFDRNDDAAEPRTHSRRRRWFLWYTLSDWTGMHTVTFDP